MDATDCGSGLPAARHGNSTLSPTLSEKYITPGGGPSVMDGGNCTVQHSTPSTFIANIQLHAREVTLSFMDTLIPLTYLLTYIAVTMTDAALGRHHLK